MTARKFWFSGNSRAVLMHGGSSRAVWADARREHDRLFYSTIPGRVRGEAGKGQIWRATCFAVK